MISREPSSPEGVKTAVLHHKTVSVYQPDYFASKMEDWAWLIYPWAVIEDLSSFFRKMEPTPEDQEEFIKRLRMDYSLEISKEIAGDVIAHLTAQKEIEVKEWT